MKTKHDTFLQKVDIFSELGQEELRIVGAIMGNERFDAEQILFREGDRGDKLFIVKEGTVAISVKLPDGQDFEISEVTSGNFFGEMSIFENAPRSATCRTKEQSVLLGLSGEDLYKLIRTHPDIASKIMYRMLNITTKRLQNTGTF